MFTIFAGGRDDPVHAEAQTALHERGGHRCCITGSQDGVKPTYIFAPSILRDPDFGEGVTICFHYCNSYYYYYISRIYICISNLPLKVLKHFVFT